MFHHFIDLRPLRQSPQFRRLWVGTSLQALGWQFTFLAVLYQVWELTHDPLWTGVVGLVRALPLIIFGLAGGVFADTLDRRELALWTTIGAFVVALMLAAQAFSGAASLPLLLGLAAAQSAFAALGGPARRTFVSRLLPGDQVASGIALSNISVQVSMLAGPALAGLIIARFGVAACYAIEVLAFCCALYGVVGLPAMRPQGPGGKTGLAAIPDGLSFIRHRPLLSGSFLTDLAATLLAMPIAIFPALNAEKFGGDPQTLGLFLSAMAVGGIVAALLSRRFTGSRHPGRVQLAASGCWGAALAGAGLVDALWLTLAFLAIAGAADCIAVIARGTILQLATPDHYRGRTSAVEQIIGVGGPELGNFRAGLTASLLSPALSMALGGVLCVLAIASIAASQPALRRFHLDTDAAHQPATA